MRKALTPIEQYITDVFTEADPLLEAMAQELQSLRKPMQIGRLEASLLQLMIQLRQSRNILELGTLAGYSAIVMARALPDNGKVVTIERNPTHIALAQQYIAKSDVSAKIELREGEALEILAKMGEHLEATRYATPIDLLFIDADKYHYLDYLDWAEQYMLPGSVIIADNTLLFGTLTETAPPDKMDPVMWHTMQDFNRRISDPRKYTSTMIPTVEGMVVAIKK